MSPISTFYCVVSSEELAQMRTYSAVPVLYAYEAGAGPRLYRSCGPTAVRGGLLGLRLGELSTEGDCSGFYRQCVLECQSRGAAGILADWDQFSRSLFQFTRNLGHQLERCSLSLIVPESYAGVTDRAGVLISSALSGGSLELRLKEALERYGQNRVILALERMSDDYILPSTSGRGRRLSRQELSALRQRRPWVYWSGDLCARYFTYRGQDGVHFVLFDDEDCLQKKIELAQKLGIKRVMAAWEEISDCAGTLLRR
jgi:hypothetical protein